MVSIIHGITKNHGECITLYIECYEWKMFEFVYIYIRKNVARVYGLKS